VSRSHDQCKPGLQCQRLPCVCHSLQDKLCVQQAMTARHTQPHSSLTHRAAPPPPAAPLLLLLPPLLPPLLLLPLLAPLMRPWCSRVAATSAALGGTPPASDGSSAAAICSRQQQQGKTAPATIQHLPEQHVKLTAARACHAKPCIPRCAGSSGCAQQTHTHLCVLSCSHTSATTPRGAATGVDICGDSNLVVLLLYYDHTQQTRTYSTLICACLH